MAKLKINIDESGKKTIDYTGGKTFWRFMRARPKEATFCIILHLFAAFMITKIILGWDSESAGVWIGLAIVSLSVIMYWIMTYRHWYNLRRGVSK